MKTLYSYKLKCLKAAYHIKKFRTPYLFTRLDNKPISNDLDEIRLFVIARNESLRLPHFIQYYFDRGVDRIFLIDNNSTDDTVPIALSYDNIHVFRTKAPYKDHWFWVEYFLNKFGKNHWCLVVDIDELLYYPYAELLSIRNLCEFMDTKGHTALRSLLLDMYAKESIDKINYTRGENPILSCPYFDIHYREIKVKLLDRFKWELFDTIVFNGGMRERVFGKNLPYHLSKISPFKNVPGTYLTQGMHAINGAVIANIQGVVLHTKFLQDFIGEVQEESLREQHYGNAILYKIFNYHISSMPDVNFYYQGSERFKNSAQLVKLGLMKSSEDLEIYLQSQSASSSFKIIACNLLNGKYISLK